MVWESPDVVRFDLESLLQGQMRTAKLKSAYNLLITSAKEVMFSPGFDFPSVCPSVYLFVNKITQNLWTDFAKIFRIYPKW